MGKLFRTGRNFPRKSEVRFQCRAVGQGSLVSRSFMANMSQVAIDDLTDFDVVGFRFLCYFRKWIFAG